MLMQIIRIVIAVLTILTGIVSLFWPMRVLGFTGLAVEGGRGVTEIRTVLGAVFIGLGVAVLLLNAPAAYQTLGITYLVMGIVRGISLFVDNSVESSNVISFAFELVAGILLLI